MLLLAVPSAGFAGPALSVPAVAPSTLASAGGTAGLSVIAQDAGGVEEAAALIRLPDGTRVVVPLRRVSGPAESGLWSGRYAAPRNFTAAEETYTVRFAARNPKDEVSQTPPVTLAVAPPAAGEPAITFSRVPPFGSAAALTGRVADPAPRHFKIAVLIYVDGLGWYSKPTCGAMFTRPRPDGSWSANIVTGGLDQKATRIAAYLLPSGFTANCALARDVLPDDIESAAVARALAFREDPGRRSIHFAGRDFWVKASAAPTGPGPIPFSASPGSVFVDSLGRLHLRLTKQDGAWHGAEVVSKSAMGNGTYRFCLDSPLAGLDPNVVVGLFSWASEASSHRELDIEFGRFGDAADADNAQFVLQPYTTPGNLHRYRVPPGAGTSEYSFELFPHTVTFRAAGPADGAAFEQWSALHHEAAPGAGSVRMNIWLFRGRPPVNDTGAEVIVRDFRFEEQTLNADRVVPASGSGAEHRFVVGYSDSAGAADLSGAYAWIAPVPDLTSGRAA
ncbi:MAG: hypothetical protein KGN36_02415, partial [Acidobacteriota bacterium]|nr:hypothetical protein [Acidobacteriota bacterium]